jgi:hypothetical protein
MDPVVEALLDSRGVDNDMDLDISSLRSPTRDMDSFVVPGQGVGDESEEDPRERTDLQDPADDEATYDGGLEDSNPTDVSDSNRLDGMDEAMDSNHIDDQRWLIEPEFEDPSAPLGTTSFEQNMELSAIIQTLSSSAPRLNCPTSTNGEPVMVQDEPIALQAVMLLVACLNLRFHLSHRGCGYVLAVLKHVLRSRNVISMTGSFPETLRPVFRSLKLTDDFMILPMCPNCRRTFPPDTPANSACDLCNTALFRAKKKIQDALGSSRIELTNGGIMQTVSPIIQVPFRRLSNHLEEFLSRPGMEDEIDAWRYIPRMHGVYRDMADGYIWKTIPGPDGRPFFDNSASGRHSDELRIAVILHFDGFKPFESSQYSSCALSHCIANLPVHLRLEVAFP